GRNPERKIERQLITDYEKLVTEVLDGLSFENARIAKALLALPEHIRGYGHVKEDHI
ncbi:MAG TPA: indolepyruvate ferredoxin oxidoreductase, partial [Thalassospira sp.]|nr:indolepyruvate ferredoxin oxidoreductase [Thalassospira sp.]